MPHADVSFPKIRSRGIAAAFTAVLVVVSVPVSANPAAERVRGFFCNSKADQIAFLEQQARGENEEMAANTVNKSVEQASCAYYLPLQAIPGKEETIFSGGLTFKIQKFVFLPEKERALGRRRHGDHHDEFLRKQHLTPDVAG